MLNDKSITKKEIESFCKLLSFEYGLFFEPSKYMFVENRVLPLMKSHSCESLLELYQKTKCDAYIRFELLNNLTTNETWFFRHARHFQLLENHVYPFLENLKQDEAKKIINVWSAGCSNGAEAYSILIAFYEWLGDKTDIAINILGSDISTNSVKEADEALYDADCLREVDCNLRLKYFIHEEYGKYRIKPEYKKCVTFENLNLIKTWPPRKFDLIFCRNTMFYFTEEIKAKLATRFIEALTPGGFFFASANELIDCEKVDAEKIYLENEILYQKNRTVKGKRLLVFKNSKEMFKAVNLLQSFKSDFNFLFNKPGVKKSLATKAFYIDNDNSAFVLELFEQNEIVLLEDILFY